MILTLLAQIGIAFLGMIVIIYGKFITTPETGKFDFKLFWSENARSVILTAIGIPLIFGVLLIVPDAAELLKTLLGLTIDLSEIDNGAAFTLGTILYATIRNLNKKA